MLGMLEHARLSLAAPLVSEQARRGSARWQCDTERPPAPPAHALLVQGGCELMAKHNLSGLFQAGSSHSGLRNSLSSRPFPSFLSLALPVFPMAFHSSSWTYFLLLWQVWQVWTIKFYEWLPLLQLITLRITWETINGTTSSESFFLLFNPSGISAWFLSACHLSRCHVSTIWGLCWTCCGQEPALPANFSAR